MVKILDRKQARKLYEKKMGNKISDTQWYATVKIFDANLPLTTDNIDAIAQIKKLMPGVSLKSVKIIADLKQTRQFVAAQNYVITGEDVLKILASFNIQPCQNTITNWFKKIGGFRKTHQYSLNQLMPIFIRAHCYALRKQLEEFKVQGVLHC